MTKIDLLFGALLISPLVMGDEVPESFRKFAVLMMITEGDSAEHLHSHGFLVSDSLKSYADDARARLDDFGKSHAEYICNHADKFTNDTEALAQYLDQQEADQRAMLAQVVDGLDNVFSEQDRITFEQFAIEHRGTGYSEPASRQLRAGEVTPELAVKAACGWVSPEAEQARLDAIKKSEEREKQR